MILDSLSNSTIVESLGWTLLHSIWQIALIAFWLFLMLRFSPRSSANARCSMSLFALALTFFVPLATFFWLSGNPSKPTQNLIESQTANAVVFNEKNQPTENFAPVGNAPIVKIPTSDFPTSNGDWQTNLSEKISAFAPVLVGLWLIGILFSALRLFGGIYQLHIFKTREILMPSDEWQRKFSALCERLEIKRKVRFALSKIVETPMVIGWLKPIVLVPASVVLNLNPRELETILAHELVHIRRFDYPINFLQNFIEILFFYHPAARWISAEIRRERECACDDLVVKILDDSAFVYANALANLEEFRQTAKQTVSPVLVAANGGKLMKRIERIVHKNKNAKTGESQNSLWSASLVSAFILALIFGLFSAIEQTDVNAQTRTNDSKTKKLAVGFVSIPPLDRMENPPKDADATARLLIEKLKSNKVPAIGFVQGGMISDGEKLFPVRAEIVRTWRDAGFEIGIGGFKHIWFYDTPVADYIANVEKNERITKGILAEKNLPLKYFSYPFLNTGKTIEDKNQFENWLSERGLKSVKYTFDNQEWMYSFAYDMARKDNDVNEMKEIRADYLDYMTRMLEHYEAYSTELFGRDIAQTLVLTSSRLVSDTADDFFGMLAKRGYKFVSMDEAQADEAYQTPENFAKDKAGISWLERWQLAQGKKLRAEPKVSQFVETVWISRADLNAPLPPKPPAPPTTPPPPIKIQ